MKIGALPRDVIARAVPHVHGTGRVSVILNSSKNESEKGIDSTPQPPARHSTSPSSPRVKPNWLRSYCPIRQKMR